ncbi:hypothetical protein PoB_005024200 [Plakobranchus ocellatus]|uniref:Ig-like domain-containing protein n=1 Tax=Plakobranchus ocellatus TaxID=259542 RepID=A0AAV4BX80_9GAST|nr:hypothetical protein PoB_005024200 [Plakobranchus ocellatus]
MFKGSKKLVLQRLMDEGRQQFVPQGLMVEGRQQLVLQGLKLVGGQQFILQRLMVEGGEKLVLQRLMVEGSQQLALQGLMVEGSQQDRNLAQKVEEKPLANGRHQRTLVLTFLKFSKNYAGTYSCSYTPVGESSAIYTRSIQLVSIAGTEQRLVCNATLPRKNDSVSWRLSHPVDKNLAQRVEDKTLANGRHQRTLVLTFLKFSKNYAGTYSCSYTPAGESSAIYTRSIQLVSMAAQHPSIAYHYGNNSLIFYCTVELENSTFFKWFKNNKPLRKGKKYHMMKSNNSLVIKNPGTNWIDLSMLLYVFMNVCV